MSTSISRHHLNLVCTLLSLGLLLGAFLGCGGSRDKDSDAVEKPAAETSREDAGARKDHRVDSEPVSAQPIEDFGTAPEPKRALNYGDPKLEETVQDAVRQQAGRDSLIEDMKKGSIASGAGVGEAWQAVFGDD